MGGPQKLEKAGNILELPEGTQPCQHLDCGPEASDLPNCKAITLRCLKAYDCGNLSVQRQETQKGKEASQEAGYSQASLGAQWQTRPGFPSSEQNLAVLASVETAAVGGGRGRLKAHRTQALCK